MTTDECLGRVAIRAFDELGAVLCACQVMRVLLGVFKDDKRGAAYIDRT